MQIFDWHSKSVKEVFDIYKTSENGLTKKAVLKHKEQYGLNKLPKEASLAWWKILLQQFTSPMIIILIVAAIVSFALGEVVDTGVIALAVLLNTVVGFFQEFKASKALDEIRSLIQPMTIVRREGRDHEVNAMDIVPGDILVLSHGDRLVADARIIQSRGLEVNEASLTGESLPLVKSNSKLAVGTVLADRKNMLYAGTSIMSGRAEAVVVAIGIETEIGKVAELVRTAEEIDTPLQAELKQLAKLITYVVVGLSLLLFAIGMFTERSIVEMIETSIAVAVAAIPEGLPISITVILAIGMQRILKRKSLVRRLIAAETLGSVSVICTDKTGTITEGEMKVTEIIPYAAKTKSVSLDSIKKEAAADEILHMLNICVLSNDATVSEDEATHNREVIGSPTEGALMEAGLHVGLNKEELEKEYPRIDEIPFDSDHKYMATLHSDGKNGAIIFLKGAPEVVLNQVSFIGKTKLTKSKEEDLLRRADELTTQGLRLIAVADKRLSTKKDKLQAKDITDFVFLGFIALRDPLRQEAKEQIQSTKKAGIRTIMITGDHPNTAYAIGVEAGLVPRKDHVITGAEMDDWSDAKLESRVESIDIYARVKPEHKIRIVKAWQKRGEVVAMTGDGVNDAPALKAADIGVALGSGTEVAKGASDLVLLDNNLKTITAAVEQGRVIFDNLRKVIVYLLASSFTEIVLIGGALLFALPLPLLPAQILWINLVADTFPNIGLTMEPGESDVMDNPPRKRNEPVLNKEMLLIVFFIGLITDVVLFAIYIWFLNQGMDIEHIRTIMFAALGIESLVYVFAIKSFRRSIFKINPFNNLWLIAGLGVGFALMMIALFVPFFQNILELTPLRLSDMLVLLIMGVVKLIAIELAKEFLIIRKRKHLIQ